MADGFDWVSRKLGVCFATFCLEATNILAEIATVHADSAPTVAVTGQVPIAMIGRDALQESDIVGIKLFHNLYKHACAVAKIQISCLRMGLVKHTTIKWTGRDSHQYRSFLGSITPMMAISTGQNGTDCLED